MNIQIRDREVFDRLNPSDLAGYLRSAGWTEIEHRPERSSLWAKDYKEESAKLTLPLSRAMNDYALRMADAVQLLAAMEERSQLVVVDDIQTSGMDIVRIQLGLSDTSDGSVSVERGTAIFDAVPDLFAAGACAAQQSRIYFATKKSKPVTDFVRQLRFGQTEYGSYVVRVLSPVPPALTGLFGLAEDPFERQAIRSLVCGLDALSKAADATLTTGDGKYFESSVALGVSANLCEAVAKIVGEESKPTESLAIRLSPARNRPLSQPLPERIVFPGDRIPIIREAGRLLKAYAPADPQEIQGVVVKLQSRGDGGIATVATFIDGLPRKVTIELPDADHKKAILAYEKRTEILCRGTLTKSGQLWSLLRPGPVTEIVDEVA